MKIAIYGKGFDSRHNEAVNSALKKLIEEGFQLIFHREFLEYLVASLGITQDFETFDRENRSPIQGCICLISIGGDGTLLGSIKYVKDYDVPIIGLNTGRLGFISNNNLDEFNETIQEIKTGKMEIETRSLLELEMENNFFGEDNLALNEITVHKQDTSAMITIKSFIDGEFLNAYWADGLIISTPTGSTAYSLACGGPIVVPNAENIIISPIAPHNLTVRPIVFSDNVSIRLVVEGRTDQFMISLDSRSTTIPMGSEIILRKAKYKLKLIRPLSHNFLKTIRAKLNWGLDERN